MAFPPEESLLYKTTFDKAEAEMKREGMEFVLQISPQWLVRWNTFKSQHLHGDELWYFEHFPEPLTGAAGYCLKRAGDIVSVITTKRS
ncbi:hypothetical protein O5O45_19585 [Hahella aquimaris]|uniref:hypothetical protein n=1 Tax=Hahella sp. HNIBRBA332 TaxID=3015983 RepID=UPI00273BF198|nr:hypothetical protein [Hahella sp. HNIBRBA332]WLQ11933.1 hypothetical protein O5O45_19585 [Hahella sp. HNIBRBA332]